MTAVSVNDLLRTRICAERGCPEEAISSSDLCAEHDRIELAKFQRKEIAEAPHIVQRTCERPGCVNEAVYDRKGIGKGLCQEHKRQAIAERDAAKTSSMPPPAKGQRNSRGRAPVARQVAPSQASKPAPEGTLVARARAVEEAQERLAQAQDAFAQAVVAMREALEAVA